MPDNLLIIVRIRTSTNFRFSDFVDFRVRDRSNQVRSATQFRFHVLKRRDLDSGVDFLDFVFWDMKKMRSEISCRMHAVSRCHLSRRAEIIALNFFGQVTTYVRLRKSTFSKSGARPGPMARAPHFENVDFIKKNKYTTPLGGGKTRERTRCHAGGA